MKQPPNEIYILPGKGVWIDSRDKSHDDNQPVKYIRSDLVASLWACKLGENEKMAEA